MLERLAGSWTVVDDDLSRNGTFVNGQRVRGRRRLNDRDILRVGVTELIYRNPLADAGETVRGSGNAEIGRGNPEPEARARRLCRPLLDTEAPAQRRPPTPSSPSRLGISTEAVRSHLKTLFRLFEVPDLPQNRKRAELARRALGAGVAAPRSGLTGDPTAYAALRSASATSAYPRAVRAPEAAAVGR